MHSSGLEKNFLMDRGFSGNLPSMRSKTVRSSLDIIRNVGRIMNPLIPQEQLVKPAEAAVLLAVCRRTLRRYAADGKLQRIKLNPRATRYRLAEVLRLAGKEVAP